MSNRKQVLQALITFSSPLEFLSQELRQFEWDYEGKPVIVKPIHIVKIINRFLSGDLNAKDVEDWANLIECREDLAFNHEQLEKIIYALANPEIEGELTMAQCQKIFQVFSPPPIRERPYTQKIGLALEWALT